eukprot:m.386245 g.386245  ORF g.386245 m.386245 type:complete len:893 (+) comp20053_c0_seq5:1119-3797(+)
MNPDYDYLIKITLAGDCRTGKSSLMRRYTEDTFSDTYEATTGTQFKVRRMEVDGKVTKQQIWDRAGEQRFGTITESYRGAHCIFVLYDVTSELSWQSVPRWLARVTEQASRNAVVVLVGNKVDREDERCVTSDEARMFAEEHGLVFTEVSAKSAHNVEGVFLTAMQTWIQKNSQASSQQGASASKANKKVARARYGLSHEAPTNSVGSSIGKLFTRIVKQKAARNLHVHQHSSGGKEIVGLIRKRRGGWPHVWQTNWLKLDSYNQVLSYGSGPSAPDGTVPLVSILKVLVRSSKRFDVATPVRVYHCEAQDDKTAAGWQRDILSAAQHIEYTGIEVQKEPIDNPSGEFGFVRRALVDKSMPLHVDLPAEIAVKFLRLTPLVGDDQRLDDFEQESDNLFEFQLEHDNIVRFLGRGLMPIRENLGDEARHVIDFLSNDLGIQHLPFYGMELMATSMFNVVFDKALELSEQHLLRACYDACSAVTYLHELSPPVLHGDVNTANFMVTTGWVVKLGDFGNAQRLTDARSSTPEGNCPLYTLQYQAPEVLASNQCGLAADVYALGVTLFEFLHRDRAYFYKGHPYERDFDLEQAVTEGVLPPERVQAVVEKDTLAEVLKCLAVPASVRPSAGHLKRLLTRLIKPNHTGPAAPPSWLDDKLRLLSHAEPGKPLKRHTQHRATMQSAVARRHEPLPASFFQSDAQYEYDVFISYRVATERELAGSLVDLLRAQHLRVFLDEDDIKTTDAWQTKFQRSLAVSRVVVCLVSRKSLFEAGPVGGIQHTTPEGPVDNYLLEIELALQMADAETLDIFPVGVGENTTIQGRAANVPFAEFQSVDTFPDCPSCSNPETAIRKTFETLFGLQFYKLDNPTDRKARKLLASEITECVAQLRKEGGGE